MIFSAALSYISGPVMMLVLAVFFLAYSVASAALLYHWKKFGVSHTGIPLARTLFVFVSLAIFGVALLAISYV